MIAWRFAVALALVSGLPLLAAFRDLLPQAATTMAPRGDPYFNLFVLEWGAACWPEFLLGFWDAPFFFPSRLVTALSDHLLLPSALYGLIRSVGAPPALAYNLLFLSAFVLTALTVFLLLRRATRCPPWAAALLALAVVYAPWRWDQLSHIQMLWAPGPPLALLFLDRLLRRRQWRDGLLFWLAFLVTLGSGSYLAYMTLLALALVLVARLTRHLHRFRQQLRRWPVLAVVALACALPGFAIFKPYIAARELHKAERPTWEVERYGAALSDWRSPSWSNRYASLVPLGSIRQERSLFPGFLLVLGAVSGVLQAISLRGLRAPLPTLGRALILIGCLFAALAHAPIFLAVAKVLPGLDGMRVPTRGHFFVLLGLAVLTGTALRALAGALSWRRSLMPALCLILLMPEVWVVPPGQFNYFQPDRLDALPPHVESLRGSNAHALAIFPLSWNNEERMWRFFAHGKPVANGYSGYLADTYKYLEWSCRSDDGRLHARCAGALGELGISHVVIEDAHVPISRSDLQARLAASLDDEARQQMVLDFADDVALVLRLGGPHHGP